MANETSTDYQIKLVNNPMQYWATVYAKCDLKEQVDKLDPNKAKDDRYVFSAAERSNIHAKWRALEERKKTLRRLIARRLKRQKKRTDSTETKKTVV